MTEGIVDHSIFDQLLEMDEDDTEREFSKGIVLNYFEQAATTFTDMDLSLLVVCWNSNLCGGQGSTNLR
jgi:osomolarity two-component system phosphorelay intermediate protein YPD1